MKVENRVHPSDEQITGFQEGDTDTPIYMLNLLKFKEKAEYADAVSYTHLTLPTSDLV